MLRNDRKEAVDYLSPDHNSLIPDNLPFHVKCLSIITLFAVLWSVLELYEVRVALIPSSSVGLDCKGHEREVGQISDVVPSGPKATSPDAGTTSAPRLGLPKDHNSYLTSTDSVPKFNVSKLQPVPDITIDMLQMSVLRRGNTFRLRRFVQQCSNANRTKPLRISIIGGSVTKADNLRKDKEVRSKLIPIQRYSELLEMYLKQVLPECKVPIIVENVGQPGTGSSFWVFGVQRFLRDDVDLVVYESAVNDDDSDDEKGKKANGKARRYKNKDEMRQAFESVLRQLVLWPSQPAVIALEAFRTPAPGSALIGTSAVDAHLQTLTWYGVPALSVRDAVVESLYAATKGGDKTSVFHVKNLFLDPVHLGARAHRMMAAMLTFLIWSEWSNSQKNIPASPMDVVEKDPLYDLSSLNTAEMSLIHQISTDDPDTFQPSSITGSWTYMEDVKGKPGWIAQYETPQDMDEPVITFNIPKIECKGRTYVYIGYLKSYEGMGMAEVTAKYVVLPPSPSRAKKHKATSPPGTSSGTPGTKSLPTTPTRLNSKAKAQPSSTKAVLDGIWENHSSQFQFSTMAIPDTVSPKDPMFISLKLLPPPSTDQDKGKRFRRDGTGNKFKLLMMSVYCSLSKV